MSRFYFSNEAKDAPIFSLDDAFCRANGIINDYGFVAVSADGDDERGESRIMVILPGEGGYRVFCPDPKFVRGDWEFVCDETTRSYDECTDRGMLGFARTIEGARALIMSELRSIAILAAKDCNSIDELKNVMATIAAPGTMREVRSETLRWRSFVELADKIELADKLRTELNRCDITRAHQLARAAKVGNIADFARKNLSAADAEKWKAAVFAVRDLRRTRRRMGSEGHAAECYRAARLLVCELAREKRRLLTALSEHNFCWLRLDDRDYCIGGFGLEAAKREEVVNRINELLKK